MIQGAATQTLLNVYRGFTQSPAFFFTLHHEVCRVRDAGGGRDTDGLDAPHKRRRDGMDAGRSTAGHVETQPSGAGGSLASRLVAVVIAALIFGALVYVSRFAPRVFGLQIIYPAPSVGPAFGIWFGAWGSLGTILGTTISQLPAGLNPLVWIPANLAQALYAILPAIFYRKDAVGSVMDWVRFAAVSAVACAIVSLVLVWNLDLNGTVPFEVGIRSVFPVTAVGNLLWMAIVGPLILNVVSPYVVKAGLKFRRFF